MTFLDILDGNLLEKNLAAESEERGTSRVPV